MNLEDFKNQYAKAGKQEVDQDALKKMMSAGRHPVLRGIRNQLIMESVLWSAFLVVYYDFFDGHLKPLLWNVLLVLSIVLLMVHNILGYQITTNPVNGDNLRHSLESYLKRIRKYSMISITTRVLAIAIIFGYFLSAVESYEDKYWSFGFLLLLMATQIYFLKRVWSGRIKRIETVTSQLT